MTSRRLLPATAVLLVAVAAPAAAAPPWSPPAPVAGAPDTNALLAAAPGGEGLLAYGVAAPNAHRTTAFGAPIDAEGAVDAAERIGRGLSVDALALYGRDRVLVAGTRVGRRDRRPIGVALGRIGEPLGRKRTLVRRAGFPLALDANRTGRAAIVTSRCVRKRRCGRSAPVLLVKRRGRGFGEPIRLGRAGRITAAATAVNARGAVLAVWARHGGRVLARVRTARGRLGRLQRLGRAPGLQTISADLAGGRRALVAVGSQQVSFAEPLGPFRAWVAYAPARRRFRARQRLETVAESGVGTYVAFPGVKAVIRRGGRSTVAWTGRDGEFFAVRAADLEGGRAGDPHTVSPPGRHAVLADLANGPRGELAIAWAEGVRGSDPAPASNPSLHAAIRPATAEAFGAPEAVSVAGEGVVSSNVGLAILPSSGRVVAAWRQVGDPIHTAVR